MNGLSQGSSRERERESICPIDGVLYMSCGHVGFLRVVHRMDKATLYSVTALEKLGYI